MTSRFEEINELIEYFVGYQSELDSKKWIVEDFLTDLISGLDQNKIFAYSKLYRVGSCYENTVATSYTTFNIAMVLDRPFTMDFFECVEVDFNGFYKLRLRNDNPQYDVYEEYLNQFMNSKYYLKVEELRNTIFNKLFSIIESITIDGYSIKIKALGSSVSVHLENSEDSIVIYIVPQIGANVVHNNIPGWYEEGIPALMSDFIDTSNVHILFALSCPPYFQEENYSHLVVQPSFSLIEKYCMLNSEIAADAVCIAKSVYRTYNLRGNGLRSFHIKRVALSLLDEIEDTGDSWDGYKLIMKRLVNMLEEDGDINGWFIEDQKIINENEEKCFELCSKIKETEENSSKQYCKMFDF